MSTQLIKAHIRLTAAIRAALTPRDDESERGDVPGWVLITLMTAGIVTILWTFAGTKLKEMFETALDGVHG
ncbi:MAG: hypothetical protein IPH03_10385 [Tetrasphaera sp.]|jgi:hypothetical protein|nr:hypothetical protein [Tetrasphaera sp.]